MRNGVGYVDMETVEVVPRENFLTGFPLIKKQQNEYYSGGWRQEINRLIGFQRPLNSPLKRSSSPSPLSHHGFHAPTRRLTQHSLKQKTDKPAAKSTESRITDNGASAVSNMIVKIDQELMPHGRSILINQKKIVSPLLKCITGHLSYVKTIY